MNMMNFFPQRMPRVWRKRLLWGLGVFLVYSLAGFLVVPALVKWQLGKQLPPVLKRETEVRQVRFNPYSLALTVRGLVVNEPDGSAFARWEELQVNFQLSSLFRWAWTFKEIRLDQMFAQVIIQPDGTFNFANLIATETNAPPAPEGAASKPPRIRIQQLIVTNCAVAFADRALSRPFTTEYRPINFVVDNLTTYGEAGTPYIFRAENDSGKAMVWTGQLNLHPFRSRGHIEISGATPAKYGPYLAGQTDAEIGQGRVDVQLDYELAVTTNGLDLVLTNGAVEVSSFEIKDPVANETVFALPKLEVAEVAADLRQRSARIGRVKLTQPAVRLRWETNGTLNLLNLVKPSPTPSVPASTSPAPPAAESVASPWLIALAEVVIEQGSVAFEDGTTATPFATTLKPIDLTVRDLTTRPDSEAEWTLAARTEADESLDARGGLSLIPVRTKGMIKLAGVDLKKYQPYMDRMARAGILSGQLQVEMEYQLDLAGGVPDAAVSNGAIRVTNLQVRVTGEAQPVVTIPAFAVEAVEASLREGSARIGRVHSDQGVVKVQQSREGGLNLLRLLPPAATGGGEGARDADSGPRPEKSVGGPEADWKVRVDEIALTDYAIALSDETPESPVNVAVDQFGLRLRNVTTESNVPVAFALKARLNQQGTVAFEGETLIPPSAPLRARARVAVAGLDLTPFQPYLWPHVNLGLASAALNVEGEAQYQPEVEERPLLSFSGGLALTNVSTTDRVGFKPFVTWDALNVSGIELAVQSNSLVVAEVTFRQFQTRLMIDTNGQANLGTILPERATAADAPAAEAAAGEAVGAGSGFPVSVGKLALDRVSLQFADQSLHPHCSFDVEELSGTIEGLSSAMNTTATVDLAGRVDEHAPFAIAGRVNLLAEPLYVDLVITNQNTQLTPFTPYLEKYAGHPLNKGRLTLDLKYQITNNTLNAENRVQIHQLTLGARNHSPEATKLPVKFAVALLKDPNGVIELDVPVKGRLDDPEFGLGPVIFKTVMNLLTKAATSPFSLLGALVGGGEELSFVEFAAGSADVPEPEIEKLDKLAQALNKRPEVTVEIAGSVHPETDRPALARGKLREQLKVRWLAELSRAGSAPQSVDALKLETADYERLLRAAYQEAMGTNAIAAMTNAVPPATATKAVAAIAREPEPTAVIEPEPPPSEPVQVRSRPAPVPRGATLLMSLNAPRPAASDATPASGSQRGAGREPATGAAPAEVEAASTVEADSTAGGTEAVPQVSLKTIEAFLTSAIPVAAEELRELITQRARAVQTHLLNQGGVSADRVLLVAPPSGDDAFTGRTRAELSLN